MDIDEIVISRIYKLMELRGLDQTALAKKAKINYQNLSRLLNRGRSITKSNVLPDIATALGVTYEEIKSVDASPVVALESRRSSRILEIQDRINKLNLDQLEALLDSIDHIENPIEIDAESATIADKIETK